MSRCPACRPRTGRRARSSRGPGAVVTDARRSPARSSSIPVAAGQFSVRALVSTGPVGRRRGLAGLARGRGRGGNGARRPARLLVGVLDPPAGRAEQDQRRGLGEADLLGRPGAVPDPRSPRAAAERDRHHEHRGGRDRDAKARNDGRRLGAARARAAARGRPSARRAARPAPRQREPRRRDRPPAGWRLSGAPWS